MNCPTCDGPLVQKNCTLLLAVGVAMAVAALVVDFVSFAFLVPALLLLAAGVFLIVWATYGRCLWCRTCKRFPARRG